MCRPISDRRHGRLKVKLGVTTLHQHFGRKQNKLFKLGLTIYDQNTRTKPHRHTQSFKQCPISGQIVEREHDEHARGGWRSFSCFCCRCWCSYSGLSPARVGSRSVLVLRQALLLFFLVLLLPLLVRPQRQLHQQWCVLLLPFYFLASSNFSILQYV